MTTRQNIALCLAFISGFVCAVTLLSLRLQIHITHTIDPPLAKRIQKP